MTIIKPTKAARGQCEMHGCFRLSTGYADIEKERAAINARAIAHMRMARSQMCPKDRYILLKEIVKLEEET